MTGTGRAPATRRANVWGVLRRAAQRGYDLAYHCRDAPYQENEAKLDAMASDLVALIVSNERGATPTPHAPEVTDAEPPERISDLIASTTDDQALIALADAMQDAERGGEADDISLPYHVAYKIAALAFDHPSRYETPPSAPEVTDEDVDRALVRWFATPNGKFATAGQRQLMRLVLEDFAARRAGSQTTGRADASGYEPEEVIQRVVAGLTDGTVARIACWNTNGKCDHPRDEHELALRALFRAAFIGSRTQPAGQGASDGGKDG